MGIKIGAVQFEPVFGEVDRNLEMAENLIRQSDADLLVLPELFNTGYVFTTKEETISLAEQVPYGKTTQKLCDVAKETDTFIVGGLAEKSGDRIFNSAVLVSPDGYVGRYRKVHLFFEEKLWFDPGDIGFKVYDIGICNVGIMICFDWFFPESMRVLSLKGAEIICHPANLVLPFCQDAMRTRCLESHVFAVTANRTGTESRDGKSLHFTGRSQITGPDGTIIYRSDEDSQEARAEEIDVEAARDKHLTIYNHLFTDRRPDYYGKLIDP
ncbi:MAG TPA: nitrilase-related carbon-nitrogen hydrolase [Syntrophales bacterium]|nr:nitrilase-related carbon-nitrogen hydrolase [Syntrophales bacterium]HPQ44024.1 nitrilase-related carbon-nitrogen hydrolase [Syntrophales bacterium]